MIFKVDAYPKDTFRGVVSQVRMNPTTVQNVVTYDAIVDFNNPELKLFPGMTAYVTIPVETAQNVLKIANGALRYKPQIAPEEIQALYRRYGIADDEGHSGTSGAATRPVGPELAIPVKDNGVPLGATPPSVAHGSGTRIVVWKLRADDAIEPVQIVVGITDHAYTAVLASVRNELKEGDQVITGALVAQSPTASAVGAPPKK